MCWKCGKINKPLLPISRNAECEYCSADLRCCKNCVYYSPGSHYDCHETVDEQVADKEKANFCGMFRFKSNGGTQSVGSGSASPSDKAAQAKNAFENLFG